MKKLLFLLFCFSVSPVFAQNAIPFCENKKVKATVTVRLNNPKYITKYSREEFQKREKLKPSPTVTGLTVTELDVSFITNPQITQLNNKFCTTLESLEVIVHFPKLIVYIDKKYPPSSCEYKVVKEHEDYHVLVAQKALPAFQKTIKRKLLESLSEIRPIITYSPQDSMNAAQSFVKKITKDLRPTIDNINKQMATNNNAIDTPQMYAKITALCDNW